MKRFYPDFNTIDAFTLALDYHQNELEYAHCLKHDQFVSHGIIYRQRSSALSEKVGKQIFCSNRYGRSGCGRTFQIYAAEEIAGFRYGAAHLFIFIIALIAKQTIDNAYFQATGQSESRHAWRWLKKLMVKLSQYRSFLKVRKSHDFNRILRVTPLIKNSIIIISFQLQTKLVGHHIMNSRIPGIKIPPSF